MNRPNWFVDGNKTQEMFGPQAYGPRQEKLSDLWKSFSKRMSGSAGDFWKGTSVTGNKWGNRALAAGGLSAVGLGIKKYLDSQKAQQPYLPPNPQLTAEPTSIASKLGSSRYVQDAASVPMPPTQPKLVAPGPSVSRAFNLKSPFAKGPATPGMTVKETAPKETEKKADGLYPTLAAAGGGVAGGVGGWLLGEKVIKPLLEHQSESIAEKVLKQQKRMSQLNDLGTLAPFGGAAVGAIILATLAASRARQKEREKMEVQQGGGYSAYDNGGFDPGEQMYIRDNTQRMFY